MAQHIRKGDLVVVTTGNERGRTAKVLRVIPKHGRVVVEGVNVVRRHVKPNQRQPQGGVIEKELPIAIANVSPVSEGKPTRVRFQVKNGSKVRVAARGGAVLAGELKKVGK